MINRYIFHVDEKGYRFLARHDLWSTPTRICGQNPGFGTVGYVSIHIHNMPGSIFSMLSKIYMFVAFQ